MSFLIVICKAWDLGAGPSPSLCSLPLSQLFSLLCLVCGLMPFSLAELALVTHEPFSV